MASQLYSFQLLSAFVGTSDSSQQSQRNTYTTDVTLTLRPERQLDHGFQARPQSIVDFNYVLLIHTGPQQLVRLYLAEFVQIGGQPMPYNLEHRESRKAIRLRYEPSIGERCQVGAEFTKRSDFIQAAQLLERFGLRFRSPQQAREPNRALGLQSLHATPQPQPLGISTPSSLSNRRAGSVLSVSQRSWSPLPWPSASSTSSQPTASSDHFSVRRPLSSLAQSLARSESPSSLSFPPQRAQSNLFIAQDVSGMSLPPETFPSHLPRSSISASQFPFLDQDMAPSEAARSDLSAHFLSPQDSRDARSTLTSPFPFSHPYPLQRQESLQDEADQLMPPPRQLPFEAKKTKTTLAGKKNKKQDPGGSETSQTKAGSSAEKKKSSQRQAGGRRTAAARSPLVTSEEPDGRTPKRATKESTRRSNKKDEVDRAGSRTTNVEVSPSSVLGAPASSKRGQQDLAAEPVRSSKRLRGSPPEEVVERDEALATPTLHGRRKVDERQSSINKSEDTSTKSAENAMPRTTDSVNATANTNGTTVATQDYSRRLEPKDLDGNRSMCDTGTQTQPANTLKDCASSCEIKPDTLAAGTQTVCEVADEGVTCDLRPSTQDEGCQTHPEPDAAVSNHKRRSESFQSKAIQVGNQSQDQGTSCQLDAQPVSGAQTKRSSASASTQTKSCGSGWGGGINSDLIGATLRLVDEVRDLVHEHLDSDLDRIEAGFDVDLERSQGVMLQSVQELAQKALDEHGDVLFSMLSFGSTARDYLRTRKTDQGL